MGPLKVQFWSTVENDPLFLGIEHKTSFRMHLIFSTRTVDFLGVDLVLLIVENELNSFYLTINNRVTHIERSIN